MTVADKINLNNDELANIKSVNKNKYVTDSDLISAKTIGTDYNYKHQIVWKNSALLLILHIFAVWGLAIAVWGDARWSTVLAGVLFVNLTTEGITIGAHRLYAHRTFKAHPILKGIVILAQTMAGQNSVFIWCRDHRLHHRYSDTDGDPHNSKRGFFFSHMGWLMTKKHPLVIELGRKLDMTDLEADWMVKYQKKYYTLLYVLLAIMLPVGLTVWLVGETWKNSFLIVYFLRYMMQVNGTCLVNSAAHMFGTRPYDRNLQPVESWFVSLISLGEGWHNYHHAFPWDYKAAELSMHFNLSATFIRWFEKIGLASDLKTVSPEMLKNRIFRTGDGTHYEFGLEENRTAVTAVGPVHPLNPTYTTVYNAPVINLKEEGLPLFQEKDVFSQESNKRRRNVGA